MKKLILGLLVLLPAFSCYVSTSGNGAGPGYPNFEEYTRDMAERFEVDPSSKLLVSIDDAELEIIGWDRSEVAIEGTITVSAPSEEKAEEVFKTFSISGEENEVVMRHDAGSIRVETRMLGCSAVQTCHAVIRCTIHVPRGSEIDLNLDDGKADITSIEGRIRIDGDDLSMNMNDIDTDFLTIDIDDGRLEGTGIKGHVEINSDDANISLKESTCDGLRISLDDGSVEIETSILEGEKYFVSSDDGDITMMIRGDAQIDIEINKDNGTFESDFPIKGKLEEHRISGTIGDGGAEMNISTDDGDIRLLKTN